MAQFWQPRDEFGLGRQRLHYKGVALAPRREPAGGALPDQSSTESVQRHAGTLETVPTEPGGTRMFGEKVDYWILKRLAHDRNRATEEELDRDGCSSLTLEQMGAKLPRVLERFEGHLPLSPDLHYLDMGCGSGELTLGLAQHGAKHIVGVDYLPRFVELARRNAERASAHANISFECADLHTWNPPRKFDVVVSFDALEHIDNPGEFLVT